MNENRSGAEGSWPDMLFETCTLPTEERPLRLAEFDQLFAEATTSVERVGPQHARLGLRPEPAVAARAADLGVRETRCCSFFAFEVRASGGTLTLDVRVPESRGDVLAALVARARAVVAAAGR
jgi:hypothetical protein